MLQTPYLILSLALFSVVFSYAYAEDYQVTIPSGISQKDSGLKFSPETLPFSGSDTITWKNEDSVSHSITSGIGAHPEYSGKFFKTGNIAPGSSGSVKVDVKQSFAFYYFCEVHPWLAGKLVVETAPESQPETPNSLVTKQSDSNLLVSGQVVDDFKKIPYDLLIYQDGNLVNIQHGKFDEKSMYNTSISSLAPGKYTLKLVYGLPTEVSITTIEISQVQSIPAWIKISAKWWSDGEISDSDFVNAIQYLAKEKVLKIQKNVSVQHEKLVPAWLKQSAGSWASGKATDAEFAKNLQYLSDSGIIQI